MAIAATHVSSSGFTVADDRTSEFLSGRKVKAYCATDGTKIVTVQSSSYEAETNKTSITTKEATLTSNLVSVLYGIVKESLPDHAHANTDITGLGTMSAQNASAVAITGGSLAGLTSLGIGTANPEAPLSFGTLTNAQQIHLYRNGNTRLGFGIGSSELRMFADDNGSGGITFGFVSTADGTTFSEKMRILRGGNVGIGTNNPGSRLTVMGNGHFNNELSIGTGYFYHGLTITPTDAPGAVTMNVSNSGPLALQSYGGKVGIAGVTNPSKTLDVNGIVRAMHGYPNYSGYATEIGTLSPGGNPCLGFYANLRADPNNNYVSNYLASRGTVIWSNGGTINFSIAPDANQGTVWALGGSNKKAALHYDGNLFLAGGIFPGDQSSYHITDYANGAVYGLQTNHNFVIGGQLGLTYEYVAAGAVMKRNSNGWVYTDGSSRRFKDNISDYTPNPDHILSLRPVTFTWNELSGCPGYMECGLIAEEVEPYYPDLVFYNNEGLVQGVHYDKLGVVLVVGYKAHDQRIAALEARIAALEAA